MRRFGSATVAMMLVGTLAVAASIWQGVATWRFLDGAARVEGRVVDAATPSRPVVAFETAGGETVSFRTDGFSSDAAGTARVDGFLSLWGHVLWGLPIGLGFAVAPFFGLRGEWRFGR